MGYDKRYLKESYYNKLKPIQEQVILMGPNIILFPMFVLLNAKATNLILNDGYNKASIQKIFIELANLCPSRV